MDPRELQRIKRMTENLNLPEQELQKMKIDIQVDLEGDAQRDPARLSEYAQRQKQLQQEEMDNLMRQLEGKSPEQRRLILAMMEEGKLPSHPFTPGPPIQQEGTVPEEEDASPAAVQDSRAALILSEDKMHALLSLTPPRGGGRPPTVGAVEAYLKKKGVVFGIDRKKVEQAVAEVMKKGRDVRNFEVAGGRAVEEGSDATYAIKFQVGEESDFRGTIHSDGVVALGGVHRGEILLETTPARPGRPGFTVLGEELQPRDVSHLQIEAKRNVRRSGNAYAAELDGIAYFYGDSILVKPYADSRVDISISDDEMLATADLRPAVGDGAPLSVDQVLEALQARKVTVGIDQRNIEDAVAKCEEEKIPLNKIPVARGTPPKHGSDGRIVFKVQLQAQEQQTEERGGRIDYREQHAVVNIKQDTLLAICFPPSKKEQDGQTVFGSTIQGRDGKAVEIKTGKNVAVHEQENGTVEYRSQIDGQIKFENSKLEVLPLYVVDSNLDMSVGNLNFLGNILIKGNVEDGFTLKAEGDIQVWGSVGASTLVAGNDILIRGGFVGQEQGLLKAERDVCLRFAENSRIVAGRNIVVERAVLHSKLAAGDSIHCTREKGQMIGGRLVARRLVQVKELGTASGTKTEVLVGVDFAVLEKLHHLDEEQQRFGTALEKIEQVLQRLEKYQQSNSEEMTEELQQNYVDLMEKKVLIEKKLHIIRKTRLELSLQSQQQNDGQVIVLNTLHSDVRITIGEQSMENTRAREKQRLYLSPENGKIEMEPWYPDDQKTVSTDPEPT